MTCFLQNINVMKDKEKLKNCFKVKETKETWQLNAMHASGKRPVLEGKSAREDIIGRLGEI